jgi:hypothetical protein
MSSELVAVKNTFSKGCVILVEGRQMSTTRLSSVNVEKRKSMASMQLFSLLRNLTRIVGKAASAVNQESRFLILVLIHCR